jgi:hypothetical protein
MDLWFSGFKRGFEKHEYVVRFPMNTKLSFPTKEYPDPRTGAPGVPADYTLKSPSGIDNLVSFLGLAYSAWYGIKL